MLFGLMACEASDHERVAETWMLAEKARIAKPQLPPVPEIIDTPPAIYLAKKQDPFDPSRTTAGIGANRGGVSTDVLFPDIPIASLTIVGFITGAAGRVAVVRSGDVYRSVRLGDRIGLQVATVKQVAEQGLLVAINGMENQWLLREK
jgi:Tfp pilus assembly protein PilP